MRPKIIQWSITIGACALLTAHLIWPSLAIDGVASTLVIAAIIPWLAPLFKKLKLPGGFEIEFQELQKAAAKAESAGLLASSLEVKAAPKETSFIDIISVDPNLALASLRIEIERRLIKIAQKNSIETSRSGIVRLLNELKRNNIISKEQEYVLRDLNGLLNEAVHGATVSPKALEWAVEIGPRILVSLDELLGS